MALVINVDGGDTIICFYCGRWAYECVTHQHHV